MPSSEAKLVQTLAMICTHRHTLPAVAGFALRLDSTGHVRLLKSFEGLQLAYCPHVFVHLALEGLRRAEQFDTEGDNHGPLIGSGPCPSWRVRVKRHARQQAAPRLTHFAHADTAQHESWRQAGDILTVPITTVKIVQGAEVEDEAGLVAGGSAEGHGRATAGTEQVASRLQMKLVP